MKQKWMHVISIGVAFLRRTWVCVVPGRRCFCLACWFLNEMSPLFMCTSANKDLCLCANPEEVNHATISVCIAFFTHLIAYWSGAFPDHMYRPLGDNIQWGNACHSCYRYNSILLLHLHVRPRKQSITVNRSGKLLFFKVEYVFCPNP